MKLVRDCLTGVAIGAVLALACTPSAKQDVKSVVDVVKVLCPDLSCVDMILADPNVTPEAKAQLRAGLKR